MADEFTEQNRTLKINKTILAVLISLLIFGPIIYWSGYRIGKAKIDKISTEPDTSTSADWSTYINDEYGISFEYPAHWKLSKDTNIMGYKNLVELTSPDTTLAFRSIGNMGPTVDLVLHYEDSIADEPENRAYNLQAKNIDELLLKSKSKKKVGTTTIDGQVAILATEDSGKNYTIMLERNGHLWEITSRSDGKSSSNPIEKQILSTFQFTK